MLTIDPNTGIVCPDIVPSVLTIAAVPHIDSFTMLPFRTVGWSTLYLCGMRGVGGGIVGSIRLGVHLGSAEEVRGGSVSALEDAVVHTHYG